MSSRPAWPSAARARVPRAACSWHRLRTRRLTSSLALRAAPTGATEPPAHKDLIKTKVRHHGRLLGGSRAAQLVHWDQRQESRHARVPLEARARDDGGCVHTRPGLSFRETFVTVLLVHGCSYPVSLSTLSRLAVQLLPFHVATPLRPPRCVFTGPVVVRLAVMAIEQARIACLLAMVRRERERFKTPLCRAPTSL